MPHIIIGIGELLWDVFPDKKRPGGAPANVIYHTGAMGNHSRLLTRVGKDNNGAEILEFLNSKGINTTYIQQDPKKPTGTVQVTFDNNEPSYMFTPDVAWDALRFTKAWEKACLNADAICFGTLAQRSEVSRYTIRSVIQALPDSTLRILDINLRPPWYSKEVLQWSVAHCDIIKLNRDEFSVLGQLFGQKDVTGWLLDEVGVKWICLTKGTEGSEMISSDSHFVQPVYPADASSGDSVGVGDAFTACLCHYLLNGSPVDEAHFEANRYAAEIVARKGAMPEVSKILKK
jgi:fructokinase